MNVLIVGASGGLGGALVDAFSARGDAVTSLSRSAHGLELTDESTIAAAAAALAGQRFDRIVVATGALTVDGTPPETSFARLDPAVMARSFAINAVGPAMLVKHLAPLLQRKSPAVFALLSARLASIGDNRLGGWTSYRSTKAALNQIVRCASVEYARKRPQAALIALHPGTVPTALTKPYARGRYTATPPEAARQLIAVMDSCGADQTGAFLAYDGTPIPW